MVRAQLFLNVWQESCYIDIRPSIARSLESTSTFGHSADVRANVHFRYNEDDSAPKPSAVPEVKSQPAVAAEVQVEEAVQNENGDKQTYGGEQDDDDEIDFNLGNGGGAENIYDAPPSNHEAHGPGIKEDG